MTRNTDKHIKQNKIIKCCNVIVIRGTCLHRSFDFLLDRKKVKRHLNLHPVLRNIIRYYIMSDLLCRQ